MDEMKCTPCGRVGGHPCWRVQEEIGPSTADRRIIDAARKIPETAETDIENVSLLGQVNPALRERLWKTTEALHEVRRAIEAADKAPKGDE